MSDMNIDAITTNIPSVLSLNNVGAIIAVPKIGVKLGGCGIILDKTKMPKTNII